MEKRLLALLCAFTMIVSLGFGIWSGKEIQAAGEDQSPTVKLVGATILKESTEQGTQSLRFLLRVSNYKSITTQDFGLNLSIEGHKSKKVSYSTAKEIYAIDETAGTLDYAVEITGIGGDNIATEIKAQGFIDEGTSTAEITKSVQDVAATAGYTITTGSDGKVTTTEVAVPEGENSVDLSKAIALGGVGKVTYDANGVLGSVRADSVEGIIVPLGFEAEKDSIVKATIYGTAGGDTVRAWLNPGNEAGAPIDKESSNQVKPAEFGKTLTFQVNESSKYLQIKKEAYNSPNINLIINKIVVEKIAPVEIDSKKPYVVDFQTDVVNDGFIIDDSTLTKNYCKLGATNFKGITFVTPERTLFDKVKITYKTSCTNVGLYVYNDECTGSYNQGAKGECNTGVTLKSDGTEDTITIDKQTAANGQPIAGICALKLARVDFSGPSDSPEIEITKVEFLPSEETTTP